MSDFLGIIPHYVHMASGCVSSSFISLMDSDSKTISLRKCFFGRAHLPRHIFLFSFGLHLLFNFASAKKA